MSQRLFVGLPVSAEIKEKIQPLLAKLKKTGADLNLVSLKNLHFTLKFLGEVQEEKISEIKEKLTFLAQKESKFVIKIKGVSAFSSGSRITAVFIGTESKELLSLMKTIDSTLSYLKNDDRKTDIAHLTLARVKSERNQDKLQKVIFQFKDQDFGKMEVEYFVLYSSELTPQGSIYKELEHFLLPDKVKKN